MKTLIILHGWQSSKEKWQNVKENIESNEIKVLLPDLPGFKPETELEKPWDLDDYVEWLKDFSRDREKFFLMGYSFGGRVAIKFAVKYPQKLYGLILVSSAGIRKPRTLNLIFLAIARFVKSILGLLKLKKVEDFLRKIFYLYILRKPDYYKAKGHLKETFQKIIEEDLTPLLKEIKIPVLVIWGEQDKITPLENALLMKNEIKFSQLEVLSNIGHTPHLENPELLAQKIKSFV